MSLHLASGLVTSLTVTVAVEVALVPLGSVAVRVTTLLPTLLQSKLVLLAERLTPQASVLPPSISAGAMVAWPVASRLTVMSLHLATGLVTSLTVTVALQVELLPLASVTVSATVLLPTLLQSKLVLLAEMLTPQAPVAPPSISAAPLVAGPVAA